MNDRRMIEAYRNEQIRRPPLILLPRISILFLTPLDIPVRAMRNHDQEENRIEPREWRIEASNQTPSGSEVDVAGIMDLASVFVPSIHH